MSANAIRVRNNPLNMGRTNADRKAYRATMKFWRLKWLAAKTPEDVAAVHHAREEALSKLK